MDPQGSLTPEESEAFQRLLRAPNSAYPQGTRYTSEQIPSNVTALSQMYSRNPPGIVAVFLPSDMTFNTGVDPQRQRSAHNFQAASQASYEPRVIEVGSEYASHSNYASRRPYSADTRPPAQATYGAGSRQHYPGVNAAYTCEAQAPSSAIDLPDSKKRKFYPEGARADSIQVSSPSTPSTAPQTMYGTPMTASVQVPPRKARVAASVTTYNESGTKVVTKGKMDMTHELSRTNPETGRTESDKHDYNLTAADLNKAPPELLNELGTVIWKIQHFGISDTNNGVASGDEDTDTKPGTEIVDP